MDMCENKKVNGETRENEVDKPIKEIVLCGSSRYTKKYFFNKEFDSLPEGIKKELNIMCVMYTEDVGGTIQLNFDPEGNLDIVTDANEDDFSYDDIGATFKVRKLQRERKEFFNSLEIYYKVLYMGKTPEELKKEYEELGEDE